MTNEIARQVARKAKAMTRQEVVVKAIAGKITWIQAAQICGITARHMRRLKERYEQEGGEAFCDHRGGKRRRKRIPAETIRELCRLKQEVYPDFSIRHFHEFATAEHDIQISYSWTRFVLQEAGIEEKAPGRGKHRRRRERRPMVGMLLHIDGSTHEWIAGLPKRDLIVVLDDADGRALYGKFFEEEGTMSTLAALRHVVTRHGRFCELYHDRGSHFGRTSKAEEGPDEEQNGHVSVALRALGIRQIFARSPQARGRSERCFGTFQGRLPQELRLKGIRSYTEADAYLERVFLPKFNRQFTVTPAQPESAFVKLVGIDVDLLLSTRHERVVRNDNTVTFNKTILQIPADKHRHHYVRCPVVVHELPDERLGISYQGRLLAFYDSNGTLIAEKKNVKKKKLA
jgi:transposase